ncbi:MAG: OadG family protein [Gammaproteobacteria bacterium]|nr:OadG family protein [Gammaproteobacteria bacterium]
MQPTLLDQGLTLMLVGMGTVFVFLSILVMGMSLMAFIVNRLLPGGADTGASDEEVAAITAAITQHRKTQQ